ncbi:unnamed protein product [Penicillium salamii]|nr:unnamed protein product [Penicillium salamii]
MILDIVPGESSPLQETFYFELTPRNCALQSTMSEEKSAKAIEKALRQSDNVWTNKWFAIAMGAMMALFAISHWISLAYFYYGPRKRYTLISKYRKARGLLAGSIMGLRADRSILYMIYWAVNIVILLTNVDLTNITYVGKRLGWVSLANLVLLVFLALKNTPLAPLTANSYEKLRPLHKVSGYTCIFVSILHAVVYLAGWAQSGSLHKMEERANFAGAIAGMAMLIIGISTITYFMRGFYELFYVLHLIMFILIMITVGMHRPKFSTSTVIIVIITACIWGFDRLVRGAKIFWNFFGNYATITALPNGALRVSLSRKISSSPGSHAFLWVPAIRFVETHPFTLVSSDPPEFVIRVYDGFTHDLYKAAQQKPGSSLRCSVDGAYGQIPNFKAFEKVILIAGGSGASFTFAIALDLIKSSTTAFKSMDFIWVVTDQGCIAWFASELQKLQSYHNVKIMIHITRQSDVSRLISHGSPVSRSEKDAGHDETNAKGPSLNVTSGDLEKGAFQQSFSGNEIQLGRPDLDSIIENIVSSSCGLEDNVIIGACGPEDLMRTTRLAVHNRSLREEGPITLYTEVSHERNGIFLVLGSLTKRHGG